MIWCASGCTSQDEAVDPPDNDETEIVALGRDDLVATRWTVVRSEGGIAALPLGGSFQFVRGTGDQSDGLILEIGCGNEATKTMTWHETGFSTSGYRTRLLGGEVCEGEFPTALSKLLDHDLEVAATLEDDLLVLRRDPLTIWAEPAAG